MLRRAFRPPFHEHHLRLRRRTRFSTLTLVHDALLGFHEATHLAWWATIPLSTLAISCITLPIAVRSRKQQQTILALQPILDARKEIIASQVRGSRAGQTMRSSQRQFLLAYRRERVALHRRHGVSTISLLAPLALKLPIWLTFSLALRSMSGTPIPAFFGSAGLEQGFLTGGIAWIYDLTAPDSALLLPVLFGMLNLINIEVNSLRRLLETDQTESPIRILLERTMRILSIAFIPLAAQMPAAVCLYWATSASVTLLQNIWLNKVFPNRVESYHQTKQINAQNQKKHLQLPDS